MNQHIRRPVPAHAQ